MQGTWKYLNRHLQDFSVVLAEVRGKIPQVKISPQFCCVYLELSNARLRMLTGGSSVEFCAASFVRGQIPSSGSPYRPAESVCLPCRHH